MPRGIAVAYAVAGVLLAAYASTLLLRRTGQFWPVLDNWGVDAFEVSVAMLCLARALFVRPGRAVGLAMGLGLLAWSIGDVLFTIESQGGASPPTPSAADACYLLMYPMAYLAVMLLIRSEVRSFKASIWLDGAVAGLGAAAIVSAFVFDTIISSLSGSPAAVAVNLAYPVGDLLLLALAVGALVIVPGWPIRLITLAAGCFVLAIGDTVYLFQSSAGTYQSGGILDASWMTALFLLSLTVWQRVRVRRAGRGGPGPRIRPAGGRRRLLGDHHLRRQLGPRERRGAGPDPRHPGPRRGAGRAVTAGADRADPGQPAPGGDRRADRAREPAPADPRARGRLRRAGPDLGARTTPWRC